jgi:mannose-6-phosphate isomerase-like protein (cupin superfamily)
MKRLAIALATFALAGCPEEKTATVSGPPLTAVPASSSAPPSTATSTATSIPSSTSSSSPTPAPKLTAADSPVTAELLDIKPPSTSIPMRVCQTVAASFVHGDGIALGEVLKKGDVLVVQGAGGPSPPSFEVKGTGQMVVARARLQSCEPGTSNTLTKRVVRANAAPDLAWAGGKMHARLDLDDRAVAPTFYMGRLEGTAPVAEHAHTGSFEVLVAIEAAGTFVLDGKEQRLAPGNVVVVPPDTKHSWSPDPGSKLVAVQLYSPPGPEQRFKKLAADAAGDAGAPPK